MVFSWAWSRWAEVGSKASRLPGADHFHDLNAIENVNLDSIPKVGAFRNMVRTLTNYDLIGAFNAWRTNNLSLASDMYDHGTHLALGRMWLAQLKKIMNQEN